MKYTYRMFTLLDTERDTEIETDLDTDKFTENPMGNMLMSVFVVQYEHHHIIPYDPFFIGLGV